MFANAKQLYRQNPLVRVNFNIILASLVAVTLSAITIDYLALSMSTISYIVLLTLVVDVVYDVLLYAILHYVSTSIQKRRAIAKSIVKIQSHRVVLAPIFYVVATVSQTCLLVLGTQAGWSVFISYMSALLLTRALHTWYAIKHNAFAHA